MIFVMSKKRNGVLKASLSFIEDWFMNIFEFQSTHECANIS